MFSGVDQVSPSRVEKKISSLPNPLRKEAKKKSLFPSKEILGPPIKSVESPKLFIASMATGVDQTPLTSLDSYSIYRPSLFDSKIIVRPSADIDGEYSIAELLSSDNGLAVFL